MNKLSEENKELKRLNFELTEQLKITQERLKRMYEAKDRKLSINRIIGRKGKSSISYQLAISNLYHTQNGVYIEVELP